ncbi:NUDIX hydrolase [Sediminibacterium sp.]|jgi:ADP-ribose pyrophosphatase YjhB (NUDIX family)|uniref:NUDIX hydrolase n=1 Tax=Sediminibacterium sp. TaxID=1917865 RepID=UPI0025CF0547|nr:NUDIX hydrolase [Sediminibacterium sp.]MBW0177268.1 NUDIX hydrolase [Sediminibacterium sp.]
MVRYHKQTRILVAIDCIIFGFDGTELKLLLVQRGLEYEKGKWSLMGGFIQKDEDFSSGSARILKELTGLEGVYMEQLYAFGDVTRDPIERTVSVAYFALIDIHKYEKQLNEDYHAEWFPIKDTPKLIFDHQQMVDMAKEKLRYKAAFHPILFELLPEKFTLPQLQSLYEGIFDYQFDKRNFSRKLQSTKLLVKQKDKDKESSKKGAFYYKLDKRRYAANFHAFLNLIPNPGNLK